MHGIKIEMGMMFGDFNCYINRIMFKNNRNEAELLEDTLVNIKNIGYL